MGFSRQEYWTVLSLPSPLYTLWNLICVHGLFHSLILNRLDSWNFTGDSVVKNRPAMQEMGFLSLGREDPLEEEMALQYSCLGNPMDREAWWAVVRGVTQSPDTAE